MTETIIDWTGGMSVHLLSHITIIGSSSMGIESVCLGTKYDWSK